MKRETQKGKQNTIFALMMVFAKQGDIKYLLFWSAGYTG